MYKVDKGLKDYNTNANYRRWNYRLNVDMDITKTTLLKVGVSGSLDKKNEPGMSSNIWASAMNYNPVSVPIMYSNGYTPLSVRTMNKSILGPLLHKPAIKKHGIINCRPISLSNKIQFYHQRSKIHRTLWIRH